MTTKLSPNALAGTRTADFARQHWHIVVDPDVTIEDVMRPGFWAHHVPKLNPMDIVDVVSQDFGLDVQLRVIGKGVGYVEMRPLRVFVRKGKGAEDMPAEDVPNVADTDIPDGYIVNHAPKTGWRVLTKNPHEEVSRQHKSKQHAIQAAIDHARTAQGQAAA